MARMRKVFWDNPYQHTLQTTVAEVKGNEMVFAGTIAYSFSGGQENDAATVNGKPILSSRMEEHTIYYTLPDNHGFKIGDAVTMKIDWQRRYRLMRLHFAAELILEIVTQLFHYEKKGAHIAEDKSRIDFACAKNISEQFAVILAEYNKIIAADKPIERAFSDVENQRRFWRIEGYAEVPCGGTHVNSTAEVGYVKLKREKKGTKAAPQERICISLVDDGADEYKTQPSRLASSLECRKKLLSTLFTDIDKASLADDRLTSLMTDYEAHQEEGIGFKSSRKA